MSNESTREPIEVGDIVLEVDNMRKYYDVKESSLATLLSGESARQVKANEGISFDAGEGETVAIVGESGCGKSTFAKVLMGLETATDGEVRLDGTEVFARLNRRNSIGIPHGRVLVSQCSGTGVSQAIKGEKHG